MKSLTRSKSNIFVLIFMTICSLLLIISIVNIIKWNIDKNKTKENIKKINDNTIIEKIQDDENTTIIETENPKKSNPYWDYIKMDMINVDFEQLKQVNNEVKGWIQVKGTNINYPFVQHENNSFYLTHGIDKSPNNAGWLFLDYRNNIDNLSKNTIIYAHGRVDNTMFGSLKNVLKESWINNKINHVINMATEKESSLWQIFSVYHIPTTSDYITTTFNTEESWNNFIQTLINRSFYNFNTNITTSDKILTLSTCYNDREKMVIHAKLIKIRKK